MLVLYYGFKTLNKLSVKKNRNIESCFTCSSHVAEF